MKKTLQKSSLFFIGMLISLFAFAQTRSITFQTIPTGAYGQSSSIAALFTPAGVFPVNNTRFNLYLSDPDGNFNSTASNTAIGSAQTHYITFINGQIPANATAANTYKLKITAFDGSGGILATATSSFSINIQNTTGTNGNATSQTFTSPADASPFISYSMNSSIGLFGRCVASSDDVYVQNNTSTSVSLSVKNEFDGTTIPAYNNDAFVSQNQNVTVTANQKLKLTGSPQKVHYRFFQTITDAAQSNTISTKAYFFMNNDLSAPFSALLNVVCYDLGSPGIFTFKTDVDPTRVGSAYFNYPGNIYTAKWDDNTANYVTSIQDIIDKSGLLTHPYSESSCGKNVVASGQTIYNSFGPSMTVAEPSNCTQTQEALTPIQIFPKPKISYTGPTKGCVGTALTFTNTSIISPQGSKTVAGCSTPNVLYYWFVDGVQESISTNFTTSSLSLGNHTIQLAPFTGGTTYSCTPAPYETVVCIEAAPPADAARFALIDTDNIRNADTTICPTNNPFLVVNKSSTLTTGSYCSTLNYNWKLTGPLGFTEINSTVSASSPNFTVPSLLLKGDYTLTLTVSNPCGTSTAFTRKITVLERPEITVDPTNKIVCDGLNTTFTATAVGSNLAYRWQVLTTANGATYTDVTNTGVYSGATTASLGITGVTLSMHGYKYKLIVSGSCSPNDESPEVTLTVNPRPTSVISGSTTVCANTPATISIALTGTAPWSITYSDGTTSTSVTTSSSTYTFSVSLATTKTYTVTSLSDANCTAASGDRTGSAVITINPLPTITGTLSACVSSTTQLTGSATADATTPWSSASTGVATISNTGLVTGISAGTSVISYKNTNGCIKTETVTIHALPTVSIPNTNQSLCLNLTPPSITTLTPTTFTTISTYQWYSNASASTSGGTAVSTSSTFTPTNTNAGELYYYLTVTNNNGCVATSNVSGSIKVFGKPTITELPTTTSYCINATAATLTPTILNGGYGTLTYQWYSNTTSSTSGATLIPNETNATFRPTTTAVGVKFYYVVVTNGGPTSSSDCNTRTSDFTEIKVYATPTITTDPVSATYCAGATPVALSIPGATAGGYGTATYQWYSNTTASTTGGTLVASTATYTPNISSAGTTYYFANVSNGATGGASGCNNLNSAIVTITVHPLPVITSSTFATESLCISSTATSMTASATTTTGTISGYQWYSNTSSSNASGTLINGATNATFTPPTSTTGTTYYFCEITNSWGCKTKTLVSGAINVYATPVINSQPTGATYCQNTTATALSVTATAGGLGTPTYQWYSNTTNTNAGGTPITGATSTTYTPSTSTVGTTYYYVNINNGGGASGCSILASNAVAILVNDSPVINAFSLVTQSICLNATPANLSVTASTAAGTISATGYQWFSNNTSSTSGAISLSGENANTYTPPTNVAGTKYYFALITNSFNCTTTTIVSGSINVNPLPTISSQPSQNIQTKCLNETFTALYVTATAGSGSISKYEWYSNTTNSTTGGTLVANNASSALTNSYTPLATSGGLLYYYVIVYNTNGCQITSAISAPFTVNDLPSISVQPSSSNQTACLNTATTNLTVSASPGSGNINTYTWYKTTSLTPVSWTVVAANTTSSTTNTYTPASNTVGSLYYYVIVTNSNGCIKASDASGSVTINPVAIINNQSNAYCSGTPFTRTLTTGGGITVPANTTFSWNSPNITGGLTGGAPGTAQTTLNGTLVNPSNTPQTATYTVIPRTGSCDGAAFTYTVTVNPKASITVADLNICSVTPFTFTPTDGTNGNIIPANTTYAWSIPVSNPAGAVTGGAASSSQTNFSGNLANTTNTQKTATYTVTPTSPVGPCDGNNFTIVVNVNARPVIANKTQTICSGTAFSITPANAGSEIVPANTTYSWTVQDNASITGESNGNTTGNTIGQTLTNNSNSVQTVVYTVTPVSGDVGNCTGPTFTITVTVNPKPLISAKTVLACSNELFTTTITNGSNGDIVPNGITYTWSAPIVTGNMTGGAAGNTALSVSGNLTNPTSVEQTATYTISPSVPGSTTCTGQGFTVVATIKPKAIIATKITAACSNDPFTFTLTDGVGTDVIPTGTTYTWSSLPTVTGGLTGGTTGSAQNTVGGTLTNPSNTSQTATYNVIANSNGCSSTQFSATATIYARPLITTQNVSSCSGSAFSVPLSNGGGNILPSSTTYTWFVSTNNNNITGQSDVTVGQSSIGQTLTNNTNVAQQITYTVTPKSGATGQCTGATFLVTVTVNPKPVITTQTQTICSNATFMITPLNGGNLIVPASTTYTWTSPTSSPLGAISGGAAQLSSVANISQQLTNNSNSQGLLTYVVTPTSGTAGSCVGTPFNVEITVSPKPILTSTLTPPAICNATNFSYNPISPTDGVSWIWTRNTIIGISNTAGTGTGVINETLINTTPNRITVPYSFALTTYGCPNTQTVNVIVNPTPQLTSLLTLPAQCSGTPFYYNPTSATVGTTYTWTRANIGGISNPAANGSGAISETLINTSPNPIVVNYVFTLTANGCTNQQSISVTIDPLPIASFNIGGVRADCGPITRTFINNSSVNSSPLTNGTFTWGIDILRNGGSVPVYSLINTNYTTQVNYTFTNTGIRDSLYPIFLTAKSPNGCLNTYRDTITVHPDARIDLTIGTIAACAPFDAINSLNVVNKTDPSPDPTINLFSSYKWTIRDKRGNILSNTVSPTPPNYTITNADDTLHIALKVNSLYGCRPDSVNRIVYTYQNPIVNFTVAPQNSCTMLSTQAVNTSYIGPNRSTSTLRYAWYANGSLLSNAGVPGTFNLINNSNTRDTIYTIKLVVSETINNCKDSSSVGNLVVYPKPKAIFTIDKADEVCTTISGVNSSINNSSLFKNGTVPQYKWSVTYNNLYDTAKAIIIDSTTAPFIAAKPNFKFKDAKGTVDTSYNINMMIYTVNGCIDTLTKSIKIRRRPNVNFTIPVEGCGIYIVNPTDNTINFPNDSLNRQWTVLPTGGLSLFSANSNIPNIIFPINNTANSIAYKVKQSVTVKGFDDCIDSLYRFITIHPKPTASFTVGKIDSCGPWTKTFRNTSDPKNGLGINAITSRWEVRKDNIVKLNTSAQNLTYTFTNTGVVDSVYTVRLFVSNPQGCLDTTALQQITVHPNARAFFNTDTLGCAPFKIRDHIKVQDFPGANDIWRYEWRIYDRFGFLQGNYDSSVLAPDYIIQNESDTVTLQLIAYSKWGCTQDIFSRQVITRPNSVKANVTADSTICANLPLAFTNTSYYGNNNQTAGLMYDWYVNDSKVTSLNSPTFTFRNNSNVLDSILYVKLVTTYTGTGCNDSVTKKITIYPAPAPNFTVTTKEICGNPVGFKNFVTESIIAKNNIYNATWALTNVTLNKPSGIQVLPTSINKRFQLQFGDNPGNIDTVYAIKLTATSINGCKADTTTNISLYRRPNIKFTISNALVCGENTLQLTDQTSNVPTSKVWSYISPTGNPLLFFPSATAISPKVLVPPNITGNLVSYYIKQVATTVNGCVDSAIVQLDAKALPTAVFSMSDTTTCIDSITIKFKDESIPRTPETIIRWLWDFGDGTTSSSQNPSHFYSKPGTYTISLVITNNEGCSSLPTRKKLTVFGPPKAAYVMPKQICLTDSIPFVNTSSLGYGSTRFISYTWDFGDGIPLNYTANPTHRFKFAGTFKVRLTVRADSSCLTSTFVDSVIVIGYPKAKFGIVNYCVESPIFFKDSSIAGYADKVGSWKWNFGDNSFNSVASPVHIYKNIGTFPVQLIVGGNLCPSMQDSITVPLKIIDRRRDSVYAIKYLQYNVSQSLCAVPGGDKYTWSPSTDINPIDSRCVNINVQHPKTTYKITIIDSAGCTITDRQEIWGFPGTDIFLPRAFIPSSNNRDNAIFKPIYVGVTAIKYFKIYDRFGHEVFTTSDMSKYWDGTSNGVNQPMETYTWIIQGFDYNNKPVIRQGNVTLIRYQ